MTTLTVEIPKRRKGLSWSGKNIKKVFLKAREETIQEERRRILSLAEKPVEEEIKIYGSDKYGISLDQIKQILDN